MRNRKLEVAKRFLVASGGDSIGSTIVDGVIEALRPAADVPEEWWVEIRRSCRTDELVARIAALYAEKITVEDLEALIACWESPAGTRYVAELPALTRESIRIGQEWGTAAAEQIQKQLEMRLDSAIEEMEEKVTAKNVAVTKLAQ